MRNRYHATLMLALVMVMTGCVHFRLLPNYDEETDKSVTQLHTNVLLHLRGLELADDPKDEKYFIAYKSFNAEIDTLITRAKAREHNELQQQQFELLKQQMALIESMHRGGVHREEIEAIRLAISRTFRAILQLELINRR